MWPRLGTRLVDVTALEPRDVGDDPPVLPEVRVPGRERRFERSAVITALDETPR